MNPMRCAYRCFALYASVLYLVAGAGSLPSRSVAAEPVSFEGTWKIATKQEFFKPEGGVVPFTGKGRQRYRDNKRYLAKKNFNEYDYATARCASPGLPRIMLTPERFRIWQRPKLTLFKFEWNRLVRQIDMGGMIKQTRLLQDDELVGRAIPISEGRWEGDTLVLTTEGFADNTLIDNLVPHGYGLKTTERLRLEDANTLEASITIEDPEYFTRTWETIVTYKRQPDDAFAEHVCLDKLPHIRKFAEAIR
jgi:hypothetical protein